MSSSLTEISYITTEGTDTRLYEVCNEKREQEERMLSDTKLTKGKVYLERSGGKERERKRERDQIRIQSSNIHSLRLSSFLSGLQSVTYQEEEWNDTRSPWMQCSCSHP